MLNTLASSPQLNCVSMCLARPHCTIRTTFYRLLYPNNSSFVWIVLKWSQFWWNGVNPTYVFEQQVASSAYIHGLGFMLRHQAYVESWNGIVQFCIPVNTSYWWCLPMYRTKSRNYEYHQNVRLRLLMVNACIWYVHRRTSTCAVRKRLNVRKASLINFWQKLS
jgi:hypothetical protein